MNEHPELAGERILALLSPGSLVHLPLLKRYLTHVFPRLDIIAPRNLDHMHEAVRRSARTHGVLLAVGGDGTLHQILKHADVAGQILGLLPTGTGNDMARTIGFPIGLKRRIARLASLMPMPTDFGTAGGIRYHNSAGFGLDSATLYLRHNRPSWLTRNYNMAFLLALARLRPLPMRITYGGEEVEGRFYWALGMNTPYIGGGTRIAPKAMVDDGLLDMVLVRETGKLTILALLPSAIRGLHLNRSQVFFTQTVGFTCHCAEPVDYLALDGELHYYGRREISFKMHRHGMMFLR